SSLNCFTIHLPSDILMGVIILNKDSVYAVL
ncbi:MAG: hypothetical protein ACI9KN_001541, partial [Gammaproteobacteria bacterium]